MDTITMWLIAGVGVAVIAIICLIVQNNSKSKEISQLHSVLLSKQTQIRDQENRISNLQSTITSKENALRLKTSEIETQKRTISNLNSEIQKLKNQLANAQRGQVRNVASQQNSNDNKQNSGIAEKIVDAADRTGVLDDLVDLGGDIIGGALDWLLG